MYSTSFTSLTTRDLQNLFMIRNNVFSYSFCHSIRTVFMNCVANIGQKLLLELLHLASALYLFSLDRSEVSVYSVYSPHPPSSSVSSFSPAPVQLPPDLADLRFLSWPHATFHYLLSQPLRAIVSTLHSPTITDQVWPLYSAPCNRLVSLCHRIMFLKLNQVITYK